MNFRFKPAFLSVLLVVVGHGDHYLLLSVSVVFRHCVIVVVARMSPPFAVAVVESSMHFEPSLTFILTLLVCGAA